MNTGQLQGRHAAGPHAYTRAHTHTHTYTSQVVNLPARASPYLRHDHKSINYLSHITRRDIGSRYYATTDLHVCSS